MCQPPRHAIKESGLGVISFTLRPSTMASNARKLPPELFVEIAHSMVSKEDLGQLRCVNSTIHTLVTPILFESITVKNNSESAQGFWDLLHTPHIARLVQSIAFVEGTLQY